MFDFLIEKGYKSSPYTITYAPQMINWNYSYSCNLNCRHCYSRTRKSNDIASTENKHKIADNIIRNNVFWVNLGGGEPILENDIYEIISKLSINNIHVSLSTNGYFFDEEKVKRLSEAGLHTASISLDHSEPAIHNSTRGISDIFDRVINAIDLCRKNNIRVMISTTVTTLNCHDIENIIRLAIEKDCGAISLKRIKMTGNAKENAYLELNEHQAKELYENIIEYKKKYPNIDINFNYGKEKIDGLDGGCSCGRISVAIMPNGDVIPCVYNDIMFLGNAITDDLADVFHSPKLEYLRENFQCLGTASIEEKFNV